MNAKELKFLELFEEFLTIDIVADKIALSKSIKKLMDFDYTMAQNVWEYLSSAKEDKLVKDANFANAVGFEILNLFYAKAMQKCVKSIVDVASIRRVVYQYNAKSAEDKALQIIVDLLVANKLPASDEIFKCLVKNSSIHYGQAIKLILEKVFIELLKKNPTKIMMSAKLADLFLTYIRKIKTEEKAMLEQRIKETR